MPTTRSTVAIGGLLSLLFVAAPPPATAQPDGPARDAATLDDVAWMAGHWASEDDGTVSEELWMPPAGGVMLGLHRDSREDPARAFFEYLRIERRGDTLVYIAQPGGGESTEFALARRGDRRVVFINPGHDFPKQIAYWLDDEGRLNASASGAVGEGDLGLRWRWERVEPADE
jgi:hypothetical protein